MIILLNYLMTISRKQKQFIMIFVDILILELAIILAYSLRQASWFWPDGSIEKLVYIAPFLAIPIFYKFGLYNSVVRYMGVKAFLFIVYGISTYMIIWASFGYYLNVDVPRSVLIYHDNGVIYKVSEYFSGFFVLCVINWLISLLLIGSSRLIVRQIYWGIQDGFFDPNSQRKNIIIYGAGEAGIQLATALTFSRELKVCGFVDDNNLLIGKNIINIKVYRPEKLVETIKNLNIDEILIAIPSINTKQKSIIINNLSKLSIKVTTLPGIEEIALGKFKIEDRKPIAIEDILGREIVPPIPDLLNMNIRGKNVLVTGAGGSIGSELCRQILQLNPQQIVLFELNEFGLYNIERHLNNFNTNNKIKIVSILGNVCDTEILKGILQEYRIHTVYHAAAYKHVPLVESNIIEGLNNNTFGTFSCIEASIHAEVKSFVLISTDKAVRPTNIMGASKRLCEMIVQALASEKTFNKKKIITEFSAVRFGNVLGSSGSVLPLFREQIQNNGPLTITHKDITRYFMTVKEAAQLVIQASAIVKTKGNIFVLDMGIPVKILELAKKMIELSGFKWTLSNPSKEREIQIIFNGLRPGEKLYEELMIDNNFDKTKHPKIDLIKEDFMSWRELKKKLITLKELLNKRNDKKIKIFLIDVIKDYKPS